MKALSPVRSAIVLAGGDGKHLRPFVRQLLGYDLPKQFATFIGTRSLLTHTYARTERLIPSNRVYTVLTQDHLRYPEVRRQTAGRTSQTVLVQPLNKGTGPGIIFPLMHVYKNHPDSALAVFPSDHFILQEDLFAAYVRRAFEVVESNPDKIVILGAEPSNPEPEYNYILPESQTCNADSCGKSTKAFVAEPEPHMAARLTSLGALWNTMVMVFKPETLLNLLGLSAPELHSSFLRISHAIGTPKESLMVENTYRDMESVDFCKSLIGLFDLHGGNKFSVIQMQGVFWSDWGCANRIISDLENLNYLDRIRPAPLGHDVYSQPSAEVGYEQQLAVSH